MISFLNPLFWLGLLALGAPLWLHLRRRTETNIHLFSTLRFLDDQPEPRRSPLRLRHLILLLLRVTGVVLLVAAFTWPYRRDVLALVVKESRVYLLDNTFSRQVADGFVQDRDRLLEELSGLPGDIQRAVVGISGAPGVVVAFSDDREVARQKLQQLQPSFQRGSYLAGFRLAKSLLDNSLGARQRIIFLSDNQQNQWQEHLQIPPFLGQIELTLSSNPVTNAPNLFLAEPQLQRIFLGDKSLVSFSVRLTHQGPAAQAETLLQANGQTILNRTLDLRQQPEILLLTAQWESDPATWVQGSVSVTGTPDALPGDNQVFFALPPLREGEVALLADSDYLRLALSPDVMRGRWSTRVLEPAQLAAELESNRDAEILVLESSYLQSGDARKLVWRYLTNQRGVFLLVNRLTPAVRGALHDLGFECTSRTTPARAAQAKAEQLQHVFSQHPVFHPFLSPDYGNLFEVEVYRTESLQATDGFPLVFSTSGQALFFQGTRFPGRLFVAAFGLDRSDTSWPVHPTFIPFLDLCLQNARPLDDTPVYHEPGARTQVRLPPGSPIQVVVLHDPAGSNLEIAVTNSCAQLPLPTRPGLYPLTCDQAGLPEKVFAVNPSPKESELSYVNDPEALRIWKTTLAEARTVPTRSAGPPSLRGILEQRIWWWLLWGGLAALLLETTWLGVRRRMT